jgi:hypothetical protein
MIAGVVNLRFSKWDNTNIRWKVGSIISKPGAMLSKKDAADQDVHVELLIGVELVEAAAMRVTQPFQFV